MTSKNKSTKYTFKGNKGGDNKYSNIFDDLSQKEEIYSKNAIKKIHSPESEEGESKPAEAQNEIREVSYEEAVENAEKRKRAIRNEVELAKQKSRPVVEKKRSLELDRIESLERLKMEKNRRLSGMEDDDFEIEDYLNNDPKYIREKARERAGMDKSNVEIFKEYSDFERPSSEGKNADSGKKTLKDAFEKSKKSIKDETMTYMLPSDRRELIYGKEGENSDSAERHTDNEMYSKLHRIDKKNSAREEEQTINNFENIDSENVDPRYLDDSSEKYTEENKKEIKERESELEEILKRKRQYFDESDSRNSEPKKNVFSKKNDDDRKSGRSSRRDRKNRSKETADVPVYNRNSRSEVYRQNTDRKTAKKGSGKVIVYLLIAVIAIVSAITIYDKVTTGKTDEPKKTAVNTAVDSNKDKEKEKEKAKEQATSDGKVSDSQIKKLEELKDSLKGDEAEKVGYIIKNVDKYPEQLVALLIRNPETVDFVYSYKDKDKYNDKKLGSDVSSSYYVDGTVPLFLQWDRRWGYRPYGKEMLGLTGCGPTSLAMVIRHFNTDSGVNPYDVAEYSKENGYLSKDNFTSWSLFEKGLKHYGLESKDVVPVEARMKRALDNGDLLITSVKPGVFTERGHIIIIKGYDKSGNFLINDPNSIANTNRSWSYDQLKNEIRKIWAVNTSGNVSSGSSSDTKSNKGTGSGNTEDNSDDPSIIQDIN